MKDDQAPDRRIPLGAELIIPIGGVLFAAYYIYSISGLPWEAQMLGLFLGALIVALALVFVVRALFRARSRGAVAGFDRLTGDRKLFYQRTGLLVLCIAYVLLVPLVGFTLITFLFLFFGMLHLGVRSVKALVLLPTALSAAGYVLFIAVLNSRLPHGIVERLLDPLVGTVF